MILQLERHTLSENLPPALTHTKRRNSNLANKTKHYSSNDEIKIKIVCVYNICIVYY